MSRIVADLCHALESIHCSFADLAIVDCACRRRVRDYSRWNPDANASNSVYSHYCRASFLYLKLHHVRSIRDENQISS